MKDTYSIDNNIRMKGVHTVQLFDSTTGKMVEEVKKNNFITVAMKDLMEYDAKVRFLYPNYSSGFSTVPVYESDAMRTSLFPGMSRYAGLHPWQKIFLTDDNGQADSSTQRMIRGNILGVGKYRQQYSGTSAIAGAYNRLFEIVEPNHLRMAFDWGTYAGNGNINSIYFGPATEYEYNSQTGTSWHYSADRVSPFFKEVALEAPTGWVFKTGINGASACYFGVDRIGNAQYSIMLIGEEDKTLRGILPFSYNEETNSLSYGNVITLNGFFVGSSDYYSETVYSYNTDLSGNIYVLSFAYSHAVYGTGLLFRKYSSNGGDPIVIKDGLTYAPVLRSDSTRFGNTATGVNDFKFLPNGDILLIARDFVSPKYPLKSLIIDASDLSTKKESVLIEDFSYSSGDNLRFVGDNMFAHSYNESSTYYEINSNSYGRSTEFYHYDNEGNIFKKETTPIKQFISQYDWTNLSSIQYPQFAPIGNEESMKIIYTTTSNTTFSKTTTLHIRTCGMAFSRNLLPSTITKTEANTMRIFYDLYFE